MTSITTIQQAIANALEKMGNSEGAPEDKFISENDLWEHIASSAPMVKMTPEKRANIYRRFLSALHSNKVSLILFESTVDSEANVIKWRLRMPIQDISAMSPIIDNGKYLPYERNSKRIEELQKEVRRLRSEINHLEVENEHWRSTINHMKQIMPPNVVTSYTAYEKYSAIIDSNTSSFNEVEQDILKIGDTLPKL